MAERRGALLVALNLSTNKRGGTEVYLEHLVARARQRGVAVTLAFADVAPGVRARLEEAGARVEVFGTGRGLVVAARLRRIARDSGARVALLHFFSLLSPVAPLLAASGARVIYVDDHSGAPARRGAANELSAYLVHRALARTLHRIVAVSDFVRRRLLGSSHMADHEVVRVYNGVREVEALAPAARRAMRAALEVADERLLLVAAGNLIAEKGFAVLIEALARNPRWSLRVAGEGPQREQLEVLARELAVDARFLGRRDDVPELMACADVVAVPSVWHEAFGFTVAEAMRAGRPVVASEIGGIPELIDDGTTGLLFPAGDPAQLRGRLGTLAGSPAMRERLGAAARAEAARRFDVTRMAHEMFEQIEEALRAHR
jgi:glycosyltransferase involved in cell wall biosynthesis